MIVKKFFIRGISMCLLFSYWCLYSQNSYDFEKQYNYSRDLVTRKIDSAEIVLDEIIINAQKYNQQRYLSKAYYLKSYIAYLTSDANNSISYAKKSFKIADKINDPIGKSLALRMEASQSAKLGLIENAYEKLKEAQILIDDIKTQEAIETKGLLYNSYLLLLNENQYSQKNYFSRKAIQQYEKLNDTLRKNQLLTSAYTNIGYNLAEMKKFDSANYYFKAALKLLKPNEVYVRCNVLHDIGYAFFRKGIMDSAVVYYNKSLLLARANNFKEKEQENNKDLQKVYKAIGNNVELKKLQIQSEQINQQINASHKKATNLIITDEKKQLTKKLNQREDWIIFLEIISIILTITICVIIYYWLFRNKNNVKKNLNTKSTYEDCDDTDFNNDSQKENITKLSLEVELKIAEGLQNFENKFLFNDKKVSRYRLADVLGVNTNYLSHYIKNNKGFSFSQYINHLRINYIVKQLRECPEYRKYKIGHLAKLTGYSSHSAFSKEFKNIVGEYPSIFINHLKEDDPFESEQ